MPDHPNVLFLMTDEHRFDVAGFAGNRVIRTPNLDKLAEDAVVFTNAYTPSPICVPGRQCMMAGMYPRHCGCQVYGEDLLPGAMTFARQFSQHGYATTACGKLHHMGTDQMQGWTGRFGDVHVNGRYIPKQGAPQSGSKHKPSQKWSDAKEIQRAGIGRGHHIREDELALAAALQGVENRYLSPYYDRENTAAPWLLKLSLHQPHYPYLAPSEVLFNHYLNRVEPFVDQPVFDHPFLSQRRVKVREDVTEREVRRATAAYYAMIENADTMFGTLMRSIESGGQNLEDWIIIYTSDHGEMLGQHGIWEKQKFFEASAKVPLIIRWPARFAPRQVEANVSLCDLFATLCDLADLPIPEGTDSRTLVSLMNGQTDGWDNTVRSEFGGTNFMVKRDALKYQWYGPAMPEVLFDLARDPSEQQNFVDDPQYADALAGFRKQRDHWEQMSPAKE